MKLFNGWAIFHCVYIPTISYPFICQWTFWLFACPGYYKECCDEHWGTCVFVFVFVLILVSLACMPSSGIVRSYGRYVSSFLTNLHTVLHSACPNLQSHQQCKRVPFSPHRLQIFFLNRLLIVSILTCMRWYLIVGFILLHMVDQFSQRHLLKRFFFFFWSFFHCL